jgi:hypothetical protein
MTSNLLSALLAVAVVTAGVGVVAQPVAADDDSFLDDVLSGDDAEGQSDGILGSVSAWARNASAWASGLAARSSTLAPGRERTAEECASDIKAEVNDHNASYEQFINNRTSARTSVDVVAVHCTYDSNFFDNGQNQTVYIVADVRNESGSLVYTNGSAVDDTDRTVDEYIVLSGLATEELPDDVSTFREEYVEPGESPNGTYVRKMGAKYAGYVSGSPEYLPGGS